MRIELQTNEIILKEGNASHVKGSETVGGYLWLTNFRLFFQSHSINIKTHEESFMLDDILQIIPHSLMPTWMFVTLKNNKKEKFVVFDRKDWIEKISDGKNKINNFGQIDVVEKNKINDQNHNKNNSVRTLPKSESHRDNDYQIYDKIIQDKKNRVYAFLLEIIPGLIGILGIGWIYCGNYKVGVVLLISFLIWDFIMLIVAILTGGISLACGFVINLLVLAISTFLLSNYVKKNPDNFI